MTDHTDHVEAAPACADLCAQCKGQCCATVRPWTQERVVIESLRSSGLLLDESTRRVKSSACPAQCRLGCLLPRSQRPAICNRYLCDFAEIWLAFDDAQRSACLEHVAIYHEHEWHSHDCGERCPYRGRCQAFHLDVFVVDYPEED